MRGNSIVRYFGESYDNVVLVAGLSKAYSSLAAFIACPPEMKRLLKTAAPPYLYSGPSPVASLATVLAGLDVNERRGDALRADLLARRRSACSTRSTGSACTRRTATGFPIIEVPLARAEQIGDVGRFLFENGIYVTLAAYPLVPRGEVGFRIQVTPRTPTDEIDQLIDVLGRLASAFELQALRRSCGVSVTSAARAQSRDDLGVVPGGDGGARPAAYLFVPPFKGYAVVDQRDRRLRRRSRSRSECRLHGRRRASRGC